MNPQFQIKLYNHPIFLLNLLFSVCLTYCNGLVVNNTGIQCAVSERVALLHFKQHILVDNCGLLDSWGDGPDCCQWHGIHCSNRSSHVIGLRLRGIDYGISYNYLGHSLNHKACLEGTLSESVLELKHLKYLDLSLNNFRGQLPKFIGSLSNLEHLNLSHAGFMGLVPQEIGNLSRLSSLDLNIEFSDSKLWVESLRWLSRLRLLKQLDLSNINLSAATNTWLPIVNSLPSIQVLRLDYCQLSLELSSFLSYMNSSSSTLNVISLSFNNMNDTSIFKWFSKMKGLDTSLRYLNLSHNSMFGNNVKVSGHAVQFLGSLCNLQTLDLSETNLHYDFSSIVKSFTACPQQALASLYLYGNNLWGSIPDNINTLSSLRVLDLSDNRLNGSISQSLWGLHMLESLNLELNSLKAVVTGEHLSNLSKLRWLVLGYNTDVVVNISANWIPPFQLDTLELRSCKVGPHFPLWLTTQKHLTFIDLSDTSISSRVPVSFFKSLSPKLLFLDMSKNMIHGVLPDVSITFDSPPVIDLCSNNFHGELPPFLRNISQLYLSNNSLSRGMTPLLCPQNKMPLQSLDLSSNLFSDKLPDCWEHFDKLLVLDLQNNTLWGSVPTSIGMLNKLKILLLNDNNISSELPSSLVNCKSLIILDISHNSLTGNIPSTFWVSFKNLSILLLRRNNFNGNLPSSFCQLSQIQILDLSNNLISGIIPSCISNLRSMASTTTVLQIVFFKVSDYVIEYTYDGAMIMWKRTQRVFNGNSSLLPLKAIDFSNNTLEGQIPEGISSLIGLKSINISNNHLSGTIPSKIGQLTSLETLDLSHNHLSGEIPTRLGKITALTGLDLSYNKLSGRIPTGPQLQTFDNSTYIGNLGLCGEPLSNCEGDKAATIPQNEDNNSPHDEPHVDDFMLGLYISVVLGLVMGFGGVFGALALKRTWRHAFFRFYADMKYKIYVVVVVRFARVWRRT